MLPGKISGVEKIMEEKPSIKKHQMANISVILGLISVIPLLAFLFASLIINNPILEWKAAMLHIAVIKYCNSYDSYLLQNCH